MKTQTFAYNTSYAPAAPFAELLVHDDDDGRIAPIPLAAQIDTRAI